MSEDQQLIVIKNVNSIELFEGDGMSSLLSKIDKEVKGFVPDTSTDKGRKEIASMAHKVAKSKVVLDDLRKELVSTQKTRIKAIDGEGKKMRDHLDALKAEIRLPLTEWEDAERARVIDLRDRIADVIEQGAMSWSETPLDVLQEALVEVKAIDLDTFEEFANEGAKAKDQTVFKIENSIASRKKYDDEQAELKRLRDETEKRDAEDAAEKLRKEGEVRARKEAEQAAEDLRLAEKAKAKKIKDDAKIEADRIEAEKNAALEAQAEAEQRAIDAEAAAQQRADDAAQAERDRIEADRVKEELAEKKREADTKHRAKINNAAADALKGITKAQAKAVITAIAKGQIPHVSIKY